MRVYIAAPYTHGDLADNIRAAIDAGDVLLQAGHTPFIPHLNHFWHLFRPQPYEQWMRYDAVWLAQCEALIRLPGFSPGADRELADAERLGLPIFAGVRSFIVWAAERAADLRRIAHVG